MLALGFHDIWILGYIEGRNVYEVLVVTVLHAV